MIDLILKFLWLIFSIVAIIWYIYGICRLLRKEKEILNIKSQIDNLYNDAITKRALHSGMISQMQLERMTEKRKTPLSAKLETLKLERQFIIEKLPLMGFFKK